MTQTQSSTQPLNDDVPPNAVVLVVDGLSAAMLGAYGNTWFETANFNRLAARSIVFDYAFSSSTNLEHAYRKFWTPDRQVGLDEPNQTRNILIDQIAKLGASTNLFTDEPLVADSSLAKSFDQVMQIAPVVTDKISDADEDTELANFFAQATSWLLELEPGSLAWIHSRGLMGAWDAPHQMRVSLAGEGDPEPDNFYQPPSGLFDLEQDDPDDLLGFQQACAAQVMLLDRFFGVLLDLLENDPTWKSTLVCFTSTRGFPLGEHGMLGHDQERPSNYNESVHVPLMVSVPDDPEFRDLRCVRNKSLRQNDLIGDCLSIWFADNRSVEQFNSLAFDVADLQNQAVVIESDGISRSSISIQSQAWKLIKNTSNQEPANGDQLELYAKPDDRWEVNDVSRRCPQTVEALSAVLDSWLETGGLGSQGPLELEESLWKRVN